MKKVIAWLLVLALTAAVSIGATLAYLTDTDEDVNVMTLGKVKIDQLEYERVDDEKTDKDATVQEFHDNKPLYPAVTDKNFDYTPGTSYVDWEQIGKDGCTSDIWDPAKINNEVDKMVFVKNKGDYDAYVRTVFAFEAGKYTTLDQFKQMVHLNLNTTDYTWEWVKTPIGIPNEDGSATTNYFIATATYNKVLAPGALTEISLSQIALDKTATNENVEAFGDTYQVLVKSQGIQADGFELPDVALKEGFGSVGVDSIPWETDDAIKGTVLRKALHYLEGDTTTNAITAKVSSVTFGLNKDYQNIADKYDGTLIDVDQDVPVYAYYVPNGDLYDIYFLANDVIYLPQDCTSLFRDMTALTVVDSENLDTSRSDNFYELFRGCTKLQEVKGVNDWDISSVTNLHATFYDCDGLVNLDLSGWDTGNVTLMDYTFANSDNLATVNGTGWDLSRVENATSLFMNCGKLQSVAGSGNWNLGNCTELKWMFQNNASLTYVDATDWNLSSLTRADGMFLSCGVLETVEGTENWKTGNIESMYAMFYYNYKLKDLDVSTWDTGKVTDMYYMFGRCYELEELEVSKWDVSSVKNFSYMFKAPGNTGWMKLKKFDVSKWNTESVTTTMCMFYGCGQLTSVDMSSWNTENLETVSHMFADCYKLESVSFAGWNTPKLNTIDALFNNCGALKRVDVSDLDTANVVEFSQAFEYCSGLEQIIGLDKWVTTSGQDFGEMFTDCSSLKVLDLSSFDTTNAKDSYVNASNGDGNDRFHYFLSGCNALEKIILGKNFSFDGDGSFTKWTFAMPSSTKVNGWDGYWYNAQTGEKFLPSEIPEEIAATYVAVNPNP
jgi:predicted ribosomally synthesized peptide with SipW-like signal peptide